MYLALYYCNIFLCFDIVTKLISKSAIFTPHGHSSKQRYSPPFDHGTLVVMATNLISLLIKRENFSCRLL